MVGMPGFEACTPGSEACQGLRHAHQGLGGLDFPPAPGSSGLLLPHPLFAATASNAPCHYCLLCPHRRFLPGHLRGSKPVWLMHQASLMWVGCGGWGGLKGG